MGIILVFLMCMELVLNCLPSNFCWPQQKTSLASCTSQKPKNYLYLPSHRVTSMSNSFSCPVDFIYIIYLSSVSVFAAVIRFEDHHYF